jgi:hypothetical protein
MADRMGGVDTSIYNNVSKPLDPFETVGKMNQLRMQQLQIDRGQVDLVNTQMNTMRSTLAGLYAKQDLSQRDIIDATGKLVAVGAIKPQQAAVELSNAPRDPAELRGWIGNHLATVAAHHQQFQMLTGTPSVVNDGQQQQAVNINPLTGQVNRMGGNAAVMANRLSPGEAASPVQGPPDASGAPTVMPKATFAERTGVAPRGQYTGQRLGGGGTMAVALPPGQGEAQTTVGGQSGKQLADDLQIAGNHKQAVYPLTQAIGALEKLGPTGTGPGTETVNQIRSFLQSAGMPLPKSSGDATKDYDEAKKYLVQYAMQNGGGGTNDRLAAAFSGNPSTGISNAAATDVAKSAVALARSKAAAPTEFARSGLPESKYSAWLADYNKRIDPVAFGADIMGPDKVKSYVAKLSPQDKKRFVDTLRTAASAGILDIPGAR